MASVRLRAQRRRSPPVGIRFVVEEDELLLWLSKPLRRLTTSTAAIVDLDPSVQGPQGRLASVRGLQLLLDHVAIGMEPIPVLDEFAAPDGPNLNPAAPFVVFR